jgi:hypothetical protein
MKMKMLMRRIKDENLNIRKRGSSSKIFAIIGCYTIKKATKNEKVTKLIRRKKYLN